MILISQWLLNISELEKLELEVKIFSLYTHMTKKRENNCILTSKTQNGL